MSWINDILNIEPILPDYWEKYVKRFDHKPSPNQLIDEISFTVFDTETTGLDTKRDLMISMAAVKVSRNRIRIQDSMEIQIKQHSWAGNESVEVHQILPSRLENGHYETEAIKMMLNFFGSDVLVAHHAEFDLRMVNSILDKTLGKKLLNKSLDTAHLAKRLEQGRLDEIHSQNGSFGLDALCEKFGIEVFERHTAAGDTFATAVLLIHLLEGLKKRGIKLRSDLGI